MLQRGRVRGRVDGRLGRQLAAVIAGSVLCVICGAAQGQQTSRKIPDLVPDRAEGEGPYERLILRGATIVDGTGAPPFGPADLVITGNRLTQIKVVGSPGASIDPDKRPAVTPGTRELDVTGMYVLPGFVDLHGHQHTESSEQGVPATYVHKLWLGHGVTTIADVGNFDVDWLMLHKERSRKNEITAPRIYAMVVFGSREGEEEQPVTSPEQAREWVRWVKSKGADGIKFFGAPPDILRAALAEAEVQGLITTEHHAQLDVTRMNVLDTARAGLDWMQHWYGLPEALFTDRVVQHYPADYNYQNEAHRFGEAGRLWRQAAPPGSARWNEVMEELLELDFTIVPTFVAYLASRDLMRQSRNEWHALYTLPSLWNFYRPSPQAHGSYWFAWSSQNEVDWRENYRLWMAFINEYKNRGGRVGIGSDSGYIYNLYGFGHIQEMELMLEAGFHPLEIFRAATISGAEALRQENELGSIQVGKLADLVVVPENPLQDLKVLYGTGALRLDFQTGEMVRKGGIRYTIKDGIVYDAPRLLADVRAMVEKARAEAGLPPPPMPLFIDTDYSRGLSRPTDTASGASGSP